MDRNDSFLQTRVARTPQDMRGAERLRYKIFVEELGGDGETVDHKGRFERDYFDPFAEQLILVDTRRDSSNFDHVVGVYRLLDSKAAERAGRFYSEGEYDLSPLKKSGRRLLELGRSCLDPAFRGGTAMLLLWSALAELVQSNQIEILFGVASFHGTEIDAIAPSLALLHHKHLAPESLRTRADKSAFQTMDLVPLEDIDRPAAMKDIPALIKAYLRLGGTVGEGAFVDHQFNTTDVCLILDTALVNQKAAAPYTGQSV